MRYFVEYNCKFIACYKSVLACIKFIERKGYKDDLDNSLNIIDEKGNMYNVITGNILKFR